MHTFNNNNENPTTFQNDVCRWFDGKSIQLLSDWKKKHNQSEPRCFHIVKKRKRRKLERLLDSLNLLSEGQKTNLMFFSDEQQFHFVCKQTNSSSIFINKKPMNNNKNNLLNYMSLWPGQAIWYQFSYNFLAIYIYLDSLFPRHPQKSPKMKFSLSVRTNTTTRRELR